MRETFNKINAAETERALRRWKIAFESRADGTLFVPGDIDLSRQGLTELPDFTQVEVGGSFNCNNNSLTSLKGAPRIIGKDFLCGDNQLQSLEYGPEKVGSGYLCHNNRLTSLKHAPREVTTIFNCSGNQLETLEGGPRKVVGYLYCNSNRLVSLKGAPETLGVIIDCTQNRLRSLKGLPRTVELLFCRDNELESLDYAPAFSVLGSDFGTFDRYEDIPKEVRFSSATRSRRERTKQARFDFHIDRATIVSRPVTVGKTLRFSNK